ncbi:hypothetical protein F4859DRAFT_324981 [Xylaria cf. heliscus]|nr:hypothetical protein F4859DRAFT_324981 [Xylaria cf. heliscus]
MSLNARARLVRAQPAHLHHAIQHRTFSASHIPFRLALSPIHGHRYSRIASPRNPHPKNAFQAHIRSAPASTASQPKVSAPDTRLEKPPPPMRDILSDPLNPPASTRPPPLDLPVRDPSSHLISYLFHLGKAYMTFYKTGLKAVFTNRRLARSSDKTSANTIPTRATLLLRARVRHDTSRLPLFALIMLICGELTPAIVLLFPRVTPYTCRIPAQAAVISRSLEARRAAAFRALAHAERRGGGGLAQVADGHICRSLGIGSPLWDRTGFAVPFAKARAAAAVGRLVQDDAMLRAGGGVRALVDDEVVLACEERGIDTLEKDIASLRRRLEAWVAKSAPSQTGDVEAAVNEATTKVRGLLLGLDGPI